MRMLLNPARRVWKKQKTVYILSPKHNMRIVYARVYALAAASFEALLGLEEQNSERRAADLYREGARRQLKWNTLVKVVTFFFSNINIHYRSKVWGHPDNFVSYMKSHTFISQMN